MSAIKDVVDHEHILRLATRDEVVVTDRAFIVK